MEKITSTIVIYKNYNDVKKAILSIEKYSDIEKKIYIVDNGMNVSSSYNIKNFKEFISQYSDVEYIDAGENLGYGGGHNRVLALLDSEYHIIANPDIFFEEDVFSPILEYMDRNTEVGMVIPDIVDEDGKRQSVYRDEVTIFDMFIRMFCRGMFTKRKAKHTLQDKDYSKPFRVPFGQGSFLVIRTELFKALKGFDENYFMYLEDADLCRRVNLVSKLMYFPGAQIVHKWEKGSHRNKILFKYHIESMKYYFDKWGYKWF